MKIEFPNLLKTEDLKIPHKIVKKMKRNLCAGSPKTLFIAPAEISRVSAVLTYWDESGNDVIKFQSSVPLNQSHMTWSSFTEWLLVSSFMSGGHH